MAPTVKSKHSANARNDVHIHFHRIAQSFDITYFCVRFTKASAAASR